MPSPSHDLRFGIEVNGQRSSTWHVRSGANKPELFVDRENLPPKVHLSLHASAEWHMKVRRQVVHKWDRPAELIPGYTRALAIVQPVAVAVFALAWFALERSADALALLGLSQGWVAADAPWECYLTDPAQHPDPKDWKTSIFWPIKKR